MGNLPQRRKIIYVGDLRSEGTGTFRFEALRRLGQDIIPFNQGPLLPKSRILSSLQFRYPVGPLVSKLNRELLKAVAIHRPDVVWLDKPIVFTPETIQAIKQLGALTVCLVQDNPFGPRNDGCWLQFKKAYRFMDLHCLVRTADIERYKAWNLPYVKIQFSYELTKDFPPPAGWSDVDRPREVSFTGSPYDDRPEFIRTLAEKYQLPVVIAGGHWHKIPNAERYAKYITHPTITGAAYREMLWKSKINLAFVTKSNEDDVAHKSFEITACAAFLLAERTPGHLAAFDEDKEAVFFSSVEECADKCRFYLDHPEERQAIALRGRERTAKSGYDNDTQMRKVLLKLDGVNETSS
jgi:spore maturation protein CgeB